MPNLSSYNTSSQVLFPELSDQFVTQSSETIDSRILVMMPIQSLYKSYPDFKTDVVTTNYVLKSFFYKKQPTNSEQLPGEAYYYLDHNLKNKFLRLVENIGITLFRKLDDKQKLLMARTAGSVEFASKIDINSVYGYINSHE